MKKQKILYVITQTEWGGAQKYLYDLVTSPGALNYEISVAVGKNHDETLINKLESKGIKTIKLKYMVRPISPINDILAVWELRRLFKTTKPDIIHTSSSKPSIQGSYAFRLSGLKKSKLIHTVHGWAFNENISLLYKKIYHLTEKLTAKYKDTIIFLSNYDKQSAKDHNIKIKNSVVIYNGLDISNLNFLDSDEARVKLNLPTDKIIIGTVANFYQTKGLEYFIRAVGELKNSDILGVVIGDGNLRPDLEELITKLDLKNNFLLLGKHDQASQYLKALDIYVSTSTKEGLPYSILEAMTANLPIIATNVGGVPEMINNKNGILIEPKNYKDLADKIKYLIDHKTESLELANQAKNYVTAKFSKAKMLKQTFLQYK
ncbi:glycosyltransferase family 4 protein [Candidatus Falkowbacteria bacterium]|uniref:Glycosyltransferase family 1 protein n=1 Tax=Candidatus Buchananbacteria bacterium CG10_big_fil_rev_8_21_14_0_10_33_19 TaxID=1974525 RepID=A0A2H0W3G4_9BACT|nr:glycosyltransferase family 4 protein [Candidatus Falkowbacteria bacterium]PIS05817.1 MAG: hypothetical protein COT80_03565 [Candidatus Buchananbacteria bacterium CG10_big_fil_rev_8_21_14_0_10_33_19]